MKLAIAILAFTAFSDPANASNLSATYEFSSRANCMEKLKATTELGASLYTSGANQNLSEITSIEAYCGGLFPNIGSSQLGIAKGQPGEQIVIIPAKGSGN